MARQPMTAPGWKERAILGAEIVLFALGWNLIFKLAPGLGKGAINGPVLLLFAAVTVPLTTILVLVLLFLRCERLDSIGLGRPSIGWLRAVVLGMAAGWSLAALVQLLMGFWGDVIAAGLEVKDPFALAGFTNQVTGITGGLLLGGFMEELVYRGYLLKRFERLFACAAMPRVALPLAILATSAWFANSHET